jgi:hypothetical protein
MLLYSYKYATHFAGTHMFGIKMLMRTFESEKNTENYVTIVSQFLLFTSYSDHIKTDDMDRILPLSFLPRKQEIYLKYWFEYLSD